MELQRTLVCVSPGNMMEHEALTLQQQQQQKGVTKTTYVKKNQPNASKTRKLKQADETANYGYYG